MLSRGHVSCVKEDKLGAKVAFFTLFLLLKCLNIDVVQLLCWIYSCRVDDRDTFYALAHFKLHLRCTLLFSFFVFVYRVMVNLCLQLLFMLFLMRFSSLVTFLVLTQSCHDFLPPLPKASNIHFRLVNRKLFDRTECLIIRADRCILPKRVF